MARRKTVAERRQEKADKENRYWQQFRPKLETAKTHEEALILALTMPPPDTTGRKFHINLQCFLQDFTVPTGSNQEERALYLQLMRRMETAGQVKSEERQQFEKVLKAM